MGPDQDAARGLERLEFLEDGTPYARRYGDVYCSRSGRGQASQVFVGGNRIVERCAEGGCFGILETGLGLGLNLVATLEALESAPASLALRYAAIELHPVEPQDLRRVHGADAGICARQFLGAYTGLLEGGLQGWELPGGARVTVELVTGDGARALARVQGPFDALYLDGFAPARNPDLWNARVFQQLARLSAPGTTLATYSAASGVRAGLAAVGFEVERLPGFGDKRHRTQGTFRGPPATA